MAADRSARTGFTGLFGKLDDEPINGLKLPIDVKAALQREAADVHLPFHEFLREILTIRAMGAEAMKDAYARRLLAIEKKVQEPQE